MLFSMSSFKLVSDELVSSVVMLNVTLARWQQCTRSKGWRREGGGGGGNRQGKHTLIKPDVKRLFVGEYDRCHSIELTVRNFGYD